ncbi:MAG: FHA domain-containing protein [Clostridia bacterium]|nr:FHA domain-containing protein [Clostridia bacterium]
MAIIKCNFCNRFYDDEKSNACPHCQRNLGATFDSTPDYSENNKTEYYEESESFFVEQKTEAYDENVQDEDKTIGIYFAENDRDPVTGWLIAVSGDETGKSFEVHMSRNFVGREKLSDIAVCADLKVVRKNHFSIIYDEKSNAFFVKSGEGSVSKNGVVVNDAAPLEENDVLEFGSNTYVFVPYCKGDRKW